MSCAVLDCSSQSCLTLCDTMDCNPPGSSVHGDSPGKNTGVSCHALLQGIFLTQGSNWEGKRREGQGSPKGGNRLQESDIFISPLSGRKKETTYECPMFFLLHTKSKGAFSAEMFFLRYVNETAFVGICLSSKWFHLKTNFFSFLKPWANNSSTNQYSYQLLYGWGMTHFLSSLSQKCLLWERGLVKLRQP